ncbi:MAG TPA: SDR family oxidoreductase [Pirellulales bacterium]|jgi:NAD(P)-dependent dehydrogenase (short-subunit alcohol dehydrogenase family)|nr:SDR family oxidoreductase [Pirellulales bacterium]
MATTKPNRSEQSRAPRKESESQMQQEPTPPFPPQHQRQPGLQANMDPQPRIDADRYRPADKLKGKAALITGGDSGIGAAVAVIYAREGADVAIVYLPQEQIDAEMVQKRVESHGRRCLLLPGDLTDPGFCAEAIERTVREFGKLDILVNNAAYQSRKKTIGDISDEEWTRTFETNVAAFFRLSRAAIPHLRPGSAIIATSSITGLEGSKQLLDYSSTKGAINAFVKALAQNVLELGIRVNAIAPGPVWTPLNTADRGMTPEQVSKFGQKTPLGRPAQPEEIAPAYVFFASDADSSFITGEVLSQLGGATTAA